MKKLTTIAAIALTGLIGVQGAHLAQAGSCGSQASETTTKAKPAGSWETSKAQAKSQGNIVETAVAAGSFKTLIAAAKAAGLAETLANGGPFTVFAPTDEAFERLPDGTLEALLEDKDQLAAILTYHVVPGTVMASDVVTMESAKTVNGTQLDIRARGDKVFVEQAKVVQTDILCSNGVIHVIDRVMLPE